MFMVGVGVLACADEQAPAPGGQGSASELKGGSGGGSGGAGVGGGSAGASSGGAGAGGAVACDPDSGMVPQGACDAGATCMVSEETPCQPVVYACTCVDGQWSCVLQGLGVCTGGSGGGAD